MVLVMLCPSLLIPAYRSGMAAANGGVIPGRQDVKFGKFRCRNVINGVFTVNFGLEKRGIHGKIAPALGR